jgi:hypothetical protein
MSALFVSVFGMKSPFPGMDPYLEKDWGDVHSRLIVYACDALQRHLPEDLVARIEERVFLESGGSRVRNIVPDVRLSTVYPESKEQPRELREGEAGLAEPVVFELDEAEITEGYIEIREATDGKVITVIEFLSPSNKRRGAGQEQYLAKQAETLRSDASLAEIDLVRAGQRVLALPSEEIPSTHRRDYLACVSPGWRRRRRELYSLPLRKRLPQLPIPLRQHEPRVPLDLQALLDQAYASGRYHKLNYKAELDPPLAPEDAAWAQSLLNTSLQP